SSNTPVAISGTFELHAVCNLRWKRSEQGCQRSRRRRWRGLHSCVPDDLSVGRSTRMIVRIHTGPDGQTHFEDLPLPAEETHSVALQAGANLVFRCFPADYWSDWHTAPRRQYIFILVGQMEIGIGDGTTRRFGPGDVVLAD